MIEAIFFSFFIISLFSLIINSRYFNYIPNLINKSINKNSNIDMKNKLFDAIDTNGFIQKTRSKNDYMFIICYLKNFN